MVYWAWILLGLGLLVVEIAMPGGLFALFFGLSAILVGGLVFLDWAGPAWVQWTLFSVLSVVALLVLRRPLQARLSVRMAGHTVDNLANETATALEDIAVGAVGKAELRGTSWSARNDGALAIEKGSRLRVDRVEGLMLLVHRE